MPRFEAVAPMNEVAALKVLNGAYAMSPVSILGSMLRCFKDPQYHLSALSQSICLVVLRQAASSGSLKFSDSTDQ